MSSFDVSFQLVDSPVDKSESGGSVNGDGLVGVFREFPFAKEIARAQDGATFPTLSFRRLSDGEEVAVWTTDDQQFDLCLMKNGKKWFLNRRSRRQVEEILVRFRNESVVAIRPPSLWRKLFG